ncbi:hypothetical protein HanRHA438_Chr01g0003751 [Helianthus annuus]|nr:hypothetical protein HanRHA438_Chr01g0003751 [Helianthus annuus]KAJ0955479.1 hypothetical protein HanPSC8_Chr01g0003351 [Helianthus annuus]
MEEVLTIKSMPSQDSYSLTNIQSYTVNRVNRPWVSKRTNKMSYVVYKEIF